jgi:photosystem II stability/assembly factor-like uncharacterized protein
MSKRVFALTACLITVVIASALANGQSGTGLKLTNAWFDGLQLRSIGPAYSPGRVADIAVDPRNSDIWYLATASSGLWKTENRGDTWKPIFDHGGSYSLGCVTLDPNNPDVVWLGTGENQALRSVSFGDGVYKSADGGKTWQNMGLRHSEHIAKIFVDPRNSDVVYVASQGPLWAPGGDRGLFKTTDGGKTWKPVLQISENTGITDMAFDPRNPDVIYAASYQRRRNVGVLIGGGPEAGIFKSVDAGASWKKLTNGIPSVDLGRIALALSPQNPDVVYALIVAAGDESGFFRSADRGETWVRQSDYRVVDPQYYGEIYPDPHHFDRLYAADVIIHVTDDGGKTFTRAPWQIHVDNHAMVFDPTDPNHLLVGNDGGLYETYDGGDNWRHFVNLPTMQFYRVAVDNALPFFHVYGGAQDNGTVGGPAQTINRVGIRDSDWIEAGGADGMQPRVDPQDPNIVYTSSQFGDIVRLDKRTGVSVHIQPRRERPRRSGEGAPSENQRSVSTNELGVAETTETNTNPPALTSESGTNATPTISSGPSSAETNQPLRWNWSAPFIISPHSHTRLYVAANRLFRSDDRGDHWTAISPDLTRHIDRNTIPVMGRLWPSNAVTKNLFTTDYGVGTALSESPLKEGLLYVGTDDGLVQVSEGGGEQWRKDENFPGVPVLTPVSALCASAHDTNTVYAAFNNYERGDFQPYLLKSEDAGQTWTSIAGNLPDRHFVWCIAEDPVKENLLFVGTEFGLFFTVDGGKDWVPLDGGMPTVAVRDLAIQSREDDLVCGTFGRGIYILDDYSPLRHLSDEVFAADGLPRGVAPVVAPSRSPELTPRGELFPPRRACLYGEIGYVRAAWGDYVTPNPPFGADFTYFLRNHATNDEAAQVVLTVSDSDGKVIRKINGPATTGIHRVNWDLRGEAPARLRRQPGEEEEQMSAEAEEEAEAAEEAGPQSDAPQEIRRRTAGSPPRAGARRGFPFRGRFGPPRGSLVKPGQYAVTLEEIVHGKTTPLGKPQNFEVVPLPGAATPE